jgi:hypothetical protein
MNTTANLIATYAAAGVAITADTADAYLTQQATEEAAWNAALTGADYDWTATRPYADQYQCLCGRGMARWAIEAMVDGAPDRILHCEDCATATSSADDTVTYVQLFTPQQIAARAQWHLAGIGAN